MKIRVLLYLDGSHFEWWYLDTPLYTEYYDRCWYRNFRGQVCIDGEQLTYGDLEGVYGV